MAAPRLVLLVPLVSLALLGAPTLGASPTEVAVEGSASGTVVFLVRHAEKEAAGNGDSALDPPLTAQGSRRAEALADALGDAKVERVLSTGFRRTLETAAPLAARLGVAIETYEPDGLETLATALRGPTGRVLVVGHSNTTPELVTLLGGEPGAPIQEHWEYDRLYVVILPANGGPAETILLRYGERSDAPAP